MITITLEGKEYQLDIEQAEKLGLLKEKYGRVKSWEEFKRKYPNYFSHLTAQESKAFDAFTKLLKLRRDWIGEWEPDWGIAEEKKYVIERKRISKFEITAYFTNSRALSFPSYELALEFLETFRGLIEEAKRLI
jgi:hypothetical protein